MDIKIEMEKVAKMKTDSLAEAIDKINKYETLLAVIEYAKGGRQAQVIDMLKDKPYSVKEIATKLNIANKNVSSILSGIRKKGHKIGTNSDNKKFFENSIDIVKNIKKDVKKDVKKR